MSFVVTVPVYVYEQHRFDVSVVVVEVKMLIW